LTSVDDDTYVDLSAATEIIVSLTPDMIGVELLDELTLKLTSGEVTLPALGIIQWRAESTQMVALVPRTYGVNITIDINGDRFVLMLGSVSVL
jgi:hypothetical protein